MTDWLVAILQGPDAWVVWIMLAIGALTAFGEACRLLGKLLGYVIGWLDYWVHRLENRP